MKEIVVIGSGNVAEALALALKKKGMGPVQIFARNRETGPELAARCGCPWTDDPAALAPAGLYVIAVSDRAIVKLSAQLDFGGAVVAHTAGSVELEALSPRIVHRAVLYPLQTFTRGREVALDDVPFLVEGATSTALNAVSEVASALSSNVRETSSEERAQLHLAAVFACNFTNYMYTIGEDLLSSARLPFDLLKPLIRETALKAVDASSPRLIQTGPAVRNDYRTKSRHCDMLVERPDYRNIYINLSKNIWETSKKI